MKTFIFGLISLCIPLTFVLCFIVPAGYSLGVLILFISSLVFASYSMYCKVINKNYNYDTPRANNISLNNNDRLLITVFIAYALGMFCFVWIDNFNLRAFDKPSKFILAVPVLYLLLKERYNAALLLYGIAIAAMLALAIALYERFYIGQARASAGIVAIMFGNISMMMGLISLVASVYFFVSKRYLLLIFSLLACMSGIMASFLSGSRGGWIALPLIGFFILWNSKDVLGKKISIGLCIATIILGFFVIKSPSIGVDSRIQLTITNLVRYINGDSFSSSGLRLDMWQSAWLLFKTSPIIGVGQSNVIPLKSQLAEQKIIHPAAASFSHAHNDYFDALSTKGIIGLVLFLCIYLVPLRLFLKKMRQHHDNWKIKVYAFAGALVPMSYIDFSLTQSMLSHNIGIIMYIFPVIYFWSAIRWQERDASAKLS